jgi:hypothetical protein
MLERAQIVTAKNKVVKQVALTVCVVEMRAAGIPNVTPLRSQHVSAKSLQLLDQTFYH